MTSEQKYKMRFDVGQDFGNMCANRYGARFMMTEAEIVERVKAWIEMSKSRNNVCNFKMQMVNESWSAKEKKRKREEEKVLSPVKYSTRLYDREAERDSIRYENEKDKKEKEKNERELAINGSSIREFFAPEPVDDLDTVEDIKTDKWFREQALQAFADPSTPQNRYDPMVSGNSGF